jgi:hypothetical protein
MRKHACSVLLALALAALPAAAEEVLYLTNGSQMPVISHWVEGDMIHVDLGGNGFMAFPRQLVERIDTDTKVKLRPSSAARGRMTPSSGRDVAASRPERPKRVAAQVDDRVSTDKYGMAVVTPRQGQGRAAEKLKRYARPGEGSTPGMLQRGGLKGGVREGNHYVLDSGEQPRRRRGVRLTKD